MVKADYDSLCNLIKILTTCRDEINNSRKKIMYSIDEFRQTWRDRNYVRLEAIISECNEALQFAEKALKAGEDYVTFIAEAVKKYDGFDIDGTSVGGITPKAFSVSSSAAVMSGFANGISDVKQWLGSINPYYDEYPSSPYSNNCGSCALSVFKRMNGSNTAVAEPFTLSIEEMEDAVNMQQVEMEPDLIYDYLKAQGAGTHVIIGIDRSSGQGHWFNAYCDGENVYAIDGQTNDIYDWPPPFEDVIRWDVSI